MSKWKYLLPFLLAASSAMAMGTRPDSVKTIEQELSKFVASGEVPGLAAALITPAGTTFLKYGVTAGATPFTPDENTPFHVASISKLFTSVSLAFLVCEGKLSLDDPAVSRLNDGGKLPSRDGKQITIRHLATHTAGLPEIKLGDDVRKEMAAKGWKFAYGLLAKLKLAHAPGHSYAYSNIGMAILGHIDELADGRPYEQMVIARILAPLGMGETRVALDPKVPRPIFYTETGIFAPAGGFHSRVTDLVKFAKAALDDAPEPLRNAFALTFERQGTDANGRQSHLGWNEEGSAERLSHTGFQHAYLGIDRTNKVAGVILCTGQTNLIGSLGNAVVTALAGGKAEFPAPRRVAKLSRERLNALSGKYGLRGGFGGGLIDVKPEHERGILLLSFDGGEYFEMWPENDSVFFCRSWQCDMVFPKEEGRPKSVQLPMAGWTGDYDRLK